MDKVPFPIEAATARRGDAAQGPAGPPLLRRRVAALRGHPRAGSSRRSGRRPFGNANQCWNSIDLYLSLAAIMERLRRRPDARGGDGTLVMPAVRARVSGGDRARPRRGDGGGREQSRGFADVAVATSGRSRRGPPRRRPARGVDVRGPRVGSGARATAERTRARGRAPHGCSAARTQGAHDGARSRRTRPRSPLAARREYLNLEKWLQERAAAAGAPFSSACLRFLRARARAGPGPAERAEARGGDDDGVLQGLQAGAGGLPPDLRRELQVVSTVAASANPTLAAMVATGADGGVSLARTRARGRRGRAWEPGRGGVRRGRRQLPRRRRGGGDRTSSVSTAGSAR